tara:strand:+ start:3282 stop:3533 length:252 start_codon:yes stop_codon:yes gene_type:complete
MTTYNNTYPNPTANVLSSFTKIRTQPTENKTSSNNKGMMAKTKTFNRNNKNEKKQPALVAHELWSHLRKERLKYNKGDVDATV